MIRIGRGRCKKIFYPAVLCAESQPQRGGFTLAQGKRGAALGLGAKGVVA